MLNLFADDDDVIPCITLWRPWAEWVALEWKTIETRFHARFKGLAGRRIAIHAGLAWDATAIAQALPYLHPDRLAESEATGFGLRDGGRVLCTARVEAVRWLAGEDSRGALIDCGSVRRFGLILADVRALPDCPETRMVKGRQGQFSFRLPSPRPAAPADVAGRPSREGSVPRA